MSFKIYLIEYEYYSDLIITIIFLKYEQTL